MWLSSATVQAAVIPAFVSWNIQILGTGRALVALCSNCGSILGL